MPGNAKSQECVLCMLISCIRITKRPNISTPGLTGTGLLQCVSAWIESKTVLTGNCTSQAQWCNWCSKGQACNHMRVIMHDTAQTSKQIELQIKSTAAGCSLESKAGVG